MMAYDCGHIGVLMGGPSAEREISFKSGKAVLAALLQQGVRASAIDIDSTDERAIIGQLQAKGIDLAFIALHGRFGEDGTVQEILERHGMPFTGSGPTASRVAMDKAQTQQRLKSAGLPTPDVIVLDDPQGMTLDEVEQSLGGGPLVVKPSGQGSSIGVTIVSQREDLLSAVQSAFRYDQRVLIEVFVSGREVTCGILGRQALPLVEIRPKASFFDYTAKYEKGMSEYIVPAELEESQAQTVQDCALRAFSELGCRDFSRVDMILAQDGIPFCLEINTIPGFTATSLLPMAAAQAGKDFGRLCLDIVLLANQRKQRTVRSAE